MLVFAMMIAPASRIFLTWNASRFDIQPESDSDPAVVGRPIVSKLSFTATGMHCNGFVIPARAISASIARASSSAFEFTVMMALIAGPFLSYASMRSRYFCTSCGHVIRRDANARWMSAIVAS